MSTPINITIAFHSKRLVFKAMEDTDECKREVVAMHQDPEVRLRSEMAVPIPFTLARATKHINSAINDAYIGVLICLQKSPEEPTMPGEVIGDLFLGKKPPAFAAHRLGDFGLTIKKGYEGKGYGPEALEWLFDMAFLRFGLHKIEGGTWGWNEPARKAYKKMGIVEEGVKRKHLWHEGTWQDEIVLGLLDEDWYAWKAKRAQQEGDSK